jgi:ABC-2 type transport system permease protein
MNALRLYGRYVSASIRAQAQYPAATLLLTAGHIAATAIEILGVFALFHRFGQVKGWSFGEVALFYGLINITFSIACLRAVSTCLAPTSCVPVRSTASC